MRGTFANVRLRNELAPDTEGWWTTHLPTGEVTSVFEAAGRYRANGTPLGVLAGKEYGSGSSRDWAAKGPALLGVRFVLAESFERIHRQNLVGMGVLPLQFKTGESAETIASRGRRRTRSSASRSASPGAGRDGPGRARGRHDGPDRGDGPDRSGRGGRDLGHGGILPMVLRETLTSA